ncbi:hypothetical protein Hypma_000638 [Hypsizygus marmoreus]|uniref:Uncharacterized protein n=1 Tax=Hypsizygus marmoreus TaxID=39966 RepID=A0A369JA79_HYPMA|nr:hypothetical protein Hypma_000638 [Hypsizygus marmoreus]
MTINPFFIRKRRCSIDATNTAFRAWNAALIFSLVVNVYLFISPLIPREGGIYIGDVSYFEAGEKPKSVDTVDETTSWLDALKDASEEEYIEEELRVSSDSVGSLFVRIQSAC